MGKNIELFTDFVFIVLGILSICIFIAGGNTITACIACVCLVLVCLYHEIRLEVSNDQSKRE